MSKLFKELVNKECSIKCKNIADFSLNETSECLVLDADEEWIKVKIENKKKQKTIIKLLRIDDVESVEVKE